MVSSLPMSAPVRGSWAVPPAVAESPLLSIVLSWTPVGPVVGDVGWADVSGVVGGRRWRLDVDQHGAGGRADGADATSARPASA